MQYFYCKDVPLYDPRDEGGNADTINQAGAPECYRGEKVLARFEFRVPNGKKHYVPITKQDDLDLMRKYDPLVKAGDPDATYQMGRILTKYDSLVGPSLIVHAADQGCTDAQVYVGDHNVSGNSPEGALDYYTKAAKAGKICGMCRLGCAYAEGDICSIDRGLAKQWLLKAAVYCKEADYKLHVYGLD